MIWRASQNVHTDSKMEKKDLSKQHSELPAGQASSCAGRSWLVPPAPRPSHAWDYPEPRRGWQQARADIPSTLSCPTAGIRQGSGLSRERTRSHTHKAACKRFLLGVRKIQCDDAQMREQGIQKVCRISLALGRCKIGMGWDLSKLGCLHLLWVRAG